MKSKMNIDELVKQQLDNFEAPMPEASWDRMNRQLDQKARTSGGTKWPWIAAGVVAVTGLSALLMMTRTDDANLANEMSHDVVNEVVVPELKDGNNKNADANSSMSETLLIETKSPVLVVDNAKNEQSSNLVDKTDRSNENDQPKVEVVPVDQGSQKSLVAVEDKKDVKPLEVSLINPKEVYCVGQSVKMNIQGGGGQGSYKINVTGGAGQLNGNEFIPYAPGAYQISVSSKLVGGSEVSVVQKLIEIRVEEAGVANLNIKFNDFASRPLHTFTASGDIKKGSAIWNIENKQYDSEKVDYFFRTRGSYDITFNYVSENGCSGKAKETVFIQDNYNLLAPNSMSLSIGGKDVFIPKALTVINLPFTMSIYSQNGTLVYQTSDATRPWDGIRQDNGAMARVGEIYIWKVTLTNEKGLIEEYGEVIVIAP